MQEIESLHRTFTSYITSINHMNYWERLNHLRLYSIERCFQRYYIIYCWKIIEDKIISPEPYDLTEIESRTGRKFIIKTNEIKNLPFNRAKGIFNSLPNGIRNTTDVNVETFKKNLDKFLLRIPDEPNVPGYKRLRCAATNNISEQIDYIMGI